MPKKLGGVCSLLPKSCTLYMYKSKLYDFPYPVCDVIENLSPATCIKSTLQSCDVNRKFEENSRS